MNSAHVLAFPSTPAAEQEQPVSRDVLLEKYAKGTETSADEIYQRVARALASNEKEAVRAIWEAKFLDNLRAGAVGAGRIMSAAGTDIQATLINCFVQPVGDCIQGVDKDGYPGIYEALREAAETMRRGGGVGYDFSRIRPRGAFVKGTQSVSSGPCSYINVFDQSCSTVESAGSRRGAQMGVLRIDHPDVLEFIEAKRTPGRWNNFNVSVAVTDAFIMALQAGEQIELVHTAEPSKEVKAKGAYQRDDGAWVYRELPAQEIWDLVMKSAYDFAEPGILFIDNMNKDNNLSYCETIEACNPCAEQPLPPYGCCDLGPIILTRFVRHPFGHEGIASFDFNAFAAAVATQVRALDNVLDITYWPLEQQRKESAAKRRIGVGFTGLGDTLVMLMTRYDSEEGRAIATQIAQCMRDSAYRASIALAQERGAFPLFDAEQYLSEGNFASRLPADIQADIRSKGIRNSHLLSIAPVGTVSLAFADNASNGIEPAFSWTYNRKKREADGSSTVYAVEDHAYRVFRSQGGDVNALPDYFVSALQMSMDDHLAMMRVVQPFIDTAISKTVNVPADCPFEEFTGLYLQAWKSGLKGLATYRPNAILGAVLEVTPAAAPAAPAPAPVAPVVQAVDPMRTVIERRPAGELPCVAEKIVYWTQEGKQALYLVVSFLPMASAPGGPVIERAIEFFMPVGQTGQSQQWITSSMRMLSLTARGGFLDRALQDMRKVAWDRGPVRLGEMTKEDGTKIPMWHDSEVAAIAFAIQEIIKRRAASHVGVTVSAAAPTAVAAAAAPAETVYTAVKATGKKCPECGAHNLIKKDGCSYCQACGYLGACG